MFSGGASGAPSTSGESSTTSTSGQGEGASCSDPPMETAQMVEDEQGGGDDESEPEGHGLSEPLPVHQVMEELQRILDKNNIHYINELKGRWDNFCQKVQFFGVWKKLLKPPIGIYIY